MAGIVKNLAPSWPAAVMGTAVVPLALNLAGGSQPWMRTIAPGFFILSLAMLAAVTFAMAARLVANPAGYLADLRHPVAGSFLPTLPIAFVIVSIDFLSFGETLLGLEASIRIAAWLFWIGAAGIWILGIAALSRLFASTEVKLGQATFGWFIPPVSQLVVAAGGLELVRHLERGGGADLAFAVSLMGFGIGSVLFFFVGAAVYHRYLFAEPPHPRMVPTAAIGFAPTAVMAIALAKLPAVQAASSFAKPGTELGPGLGYLALALWGFSVFGFLLALVTIVRGFKEMRGHFGLPWWAMIFPLGALAVSTGAIGRLLGTAVFDPVLAALDFLLLAAWSAVAAATARGIFDGSIFARD